MRIYTRRGDEGQTDLGNRSRVSKASPRIETYGTIDEVNALVGTIRPSGYDDLDEYLTAIQNHLHILQAEFANPNGGEDAPHVTAAHVEMLEDWIDAANEDLEPMTSFILPGGSETGARLHHARTVCRRAERRAVALAGEADVSEDALAYLNRLSDALFVFARLANHRDGEPEDAPTY